MEIIRAQSMGFCFGVRDAIDVVRELGQSGTPVYTLGAIVHNPQIADELEEINVHVIDDLDEAPADSIIAITAHGAPPSLDLYFAQVAELDGDEPSIAELQRRHGVTIHRPAED